MAVEIAYDSESNVAMMFCNTTDTAFGPIFTGITAKQDAEDFIEWLRENPGDVADARIIGNGTDPRDYPADSLEEIVNHWRDLQTEAA